MSVTVVVEGGERIQLRTATILSNTLCACFDWMHRLRWLLAGVGGGWMSQMCGPT
jgi:hypothetical protein